MTLKTVQTLARLSVSAREAAAISGVSRASVYKLINDGKIAFLMIGNRRLILLKDLEEYLISVRKRERTTDAIGDQRTAPSVVNSI